MDALGLLHTGATVGVNASFAWLAGALCSAYLFHDGTPCRAALATLWTSITLAAALCLAASFLALWCALALMGDLPLIEALALLPQMLLDTAYGRLALGGLLALALILLLGLVRRRWLLPMACLLLAFALTRASISHAGEHGLLSAGTAIEWVHLVLMGLWVGLVAVAGWLVLPAERGPSSSRQAYLGSVSTTATLALGGIVATGLFNAWNRIETPGQLLTHDYGIALSLKLALVGCAVVLGGYNRFYGFPAASQLPQRAILVLRIESLILLAALVAAAVLTLQSPPR